ncbi:MAG: RNA polymerase sigma-70 factor [Salinivirgaceae bacterium]|nr:RNA polymerase sigma-70 factor [Salinivirgaceae bacterium]
MQKNEIKTLKEIKKGNIKEYENLFRSNYAALCGYALKLLKDPDLAEEMVQELFYIIWKNRKSLYVNVSLKSYLYKSVYNKCMHYFEHKKVEEKYASYIKHCNESNYSIDEAMNTGELYSVYKKILNNLPERSRQIFKLSRNYGFKYQEIAEKLSISVKTVEANMGKALKAFRQGFAEYN